MSILDIARRYVTARYSLCPIRPDGTKRPATEWKPFQSAAPTDEDLQFWYSPLTDLDAAEGVTTLPGIALIHGAVSGNSEALDFDGPDAWQEFSALAEAQGLTDLVARCVAVASPGGGRHLCYRCSAPVDGNLKLARYADGKTKIETRGEGGYTVAPGSPAACHSTGKPYKLVAGKFSAVPVLTPEERATLLALASGCNAYAEPERLISPTEPNTRPDGELRPGEEYNQRGDILNLLLKHGWTIFHQRADTIHLTRPGKKTKEGFSATLGYVAPGFLYVFSTNAAPFRAETGYSPFAVYGMLEHSGDFAAAARELAKSGYGAPLPPQAQILIDRYEPKVRVINTPTPAPTSEDPFAGEEAPSPNLHAQCAEFPCTELGNAERFALRHGKDVRHCPSTGWLTWDGLLWQNDVSGEVTRRMCQTVRNILSEAKEVQTQATKTDDEDDRKKLLDKVTFLNKWALKSEAYRSTVASLKYGEAQPNIHVPFDHLDRNPWLLGCNNGTLNLKTGKLRKPRRTDLITKSVVVDYDPSAKCPLWEAFLERILPDPEVRAYIQRAIGYALTGDVSEQCIFFFYGKGSNGKTTLLKVVQFLLGAYGWQASPELLVMKPNGSMVRDDVAALAGRRFVVTVETEVGQVLAESLVKQLTGGDRITARFLYKNSFQYDPTAKIFLASNHKPVVRSNDYGIWRRIKLIPFTQQIREDEKDTQFPEKLAAEYPGILAWAVRGCQEWQRIGLCEPEIVKAQTREYKDESDLLGEFLAEKCVAGDTEKHRVRPTALYRVYTAWCDERREKPKTLTAFGRELAERSVEKKKVRGDFWYVGLSLLANEDELPEPPTEGADTPEEVLELVAPPMPDSSLISLPEAPEPETRAASPGPVKFVWRDLHLGGNEWQRVVTVATSIGQKIGKGPSKTEALADLNRILHADLPRGSELDAIAKVLTEDWNTYRVEEGMPRSGSSKNGRASRSP